MFNIILQSQGNDYFLPDFTRQLKGYNEVGRKKMFSKNLIINVLNDVIVRSDVTKKSVFWTCPSLQWTSSIKKSPFTYVVPACCNTMVISEHSTSSINLHNITENPIPFPFSR